jgi:hypothetical protein
MLHAVGKILKVAGFGDQLQLPYTRADGNPHLMGVNDACERQTIFLAARGLGQEVFILSKQNPLELGCSIQQDVIRCLSMSILLSCQNVHPAQAQTGRDGPVNVLIHV